MAVYFENGVSDGACDDFVSDFLICTGSSYWVDSVNGNDSNSGTESLPFATLAHAISTCSANNGDVIFVKSGHVETLSSAITINAAGLKIFGIGAGSAAPKFTVAAAINGFNITANNVEINNLYFPVGTTIANTCRVQIDAANVRIKGCTFLCGTYDANTILLTANALYAEVESCSMTVSASGPSAGIKVNSASAVGFKVSNCAFNGGTSTNWGNGAIYSAVAHLNFFYNRVTLTLGADIRHTAAAKGYIGALNSDEASEVQA